MLNTRLTTSLFTAVIALLVSCFSVADVRLPKLIADGAVLQRDQPLLLWGYAAEGEQVRVTFNQQQATTQAINGRWQVTLKPMPAGGPYQLTINANNQLQLNDIWLGDVYVAAGQSNIELPIDRVRYRYPDVLTQTNLPTVREFGVPLSYAFSGEQEDYQAGIWQSANPETISQFSAVGFFFAQALQQKLKVPIGVIRIPVGGSPIEAWISEETLQYYPHYLEQLSPFKQPGYAEAVAAKDKASSDHWYQSLAANDQGLKEHWQTLHALPKASMVELPGDISNEQITLKYGSLWLSKTLTLTQAQAALPATLWLGVIVDGDETYVNGVAVGQVGYQYPPRIYKIPQGVLKAGDNQITLRLTSVSGKPRFIRDKRYALELGGVDIPLAGQWQLALGAEHGPKPATTTLHYIPSSLYNARVAPLKYTGLTGVLWYQGESNVGRQRLAPRRDQALLNNMGYHNHYQGEYLSLLNDLIHNWRVLFNKPTLPFMVVQLPNFLTPNQSTEDSAWAMMREAQRLATGISHVGMVPAIDLGEWNDIHPLEKRVVGERLAMLAQKMIYHEKHLIAEAPQPVKLERSNNSLIVQFNHTGQGLYQQGEQPLHLFIAGSDNIFYRAEAVVGKNAVRLSAAEVPNPTRVRYAYADNPVGAILYNSAHIPASPFDISLLNNNGTSE